MTTPDATDPRPAGPTPPRRRRRGPTPTASTPAPTAAAEPPQMGRVRVFPQYEFPVHQPGGVGLDQTITVTDWYKQGSAWAEKEAHRQVQAALGEPGDGSWWLGRGKKDTYRWQPFKGTPRGALPVDPAAQPLWQPQLPDDTHAAGPETGPETAETGPGTGLVDPARVAELLDDAFPPSSADVEAQMRADMGLQQVDPLGDKDTYGAGGEVFTPQRRRQIIDQAAASGTPFALHPADLSPGDRVLHGQRLATVTEVDDDSVLIDYGREIDPGAPGSRGLRVLNLSLESGALRRVPAGSTLASLEDRLPPAEQAQRYTDRRAHHEQERGTGKRARAGYRKHKATCTTCQDLDAGGDGVGRALRVVAPDTTAAAGAEQYPVKFTFTGGAGAGDETEVRHWRWEQALETLQGQVGCYGIPDDGSGVLDVDTFIASIGGYVGGVAGVLQQVADTLGGGQTPVAPVVGEALLEFADALMSMAGAAGEVYERWADNPDNRHDLARARGEIPGAQLFNVLP